MYTTFFHRGELVTAFGGIDGLFRASDGRVFQYVTDKNGSYLKLKYGPKFLAYKTGLVEIRYREDGQWHASDGTIYALTDDSASVDEQIRCGIGMLSFNSDFPLTDACRSHDYMYSSPTFQLFHTREEADKWLESLGTQIAAQSNLPILAPIARIFRWVSTLFGGKYWENKATR